IVMCYLLPIIKVGSSSYLKPDMFFLPMVIVVIVLKWRTIEQLPIAKKYMLILVAIFFISMLSNSIGSYYYLGRSGLTISPKYNLIFSKIIFFILFLYVAALQI